MRLIDADALITDYIVTSTTTNTPVYQYVSKEQIAKAPTISSPRLVSCEERMPDLLQFVVVCNDEGKCVVAQYVGYQTDSLTPWRIAYTMYDTDIYDEKERGPVTHWMPLPEPPKEGED